MHKAQFANEPDTNITSAAHIQSMLKGPDSPRSISPAAVPLHGLRSEQFATSIAVAQH